VDSPVSVRTIKAFEDIEVLFHPFLTSVFDKGLLPLCLWGSALSTTEYEAG